jgi:hypothetical protein
MEAVWVNLGKFGPADQGSAHEDPTPDPPESTAVFSGLRPSLLIGSDMIPDLRATSDDGRKRKRAIALFRIILSRFWTTFSRFNTLPLRR